MREGKTSIWTYLIPVFKMLKLEQRRRVEGDEFDVCGASGKMSEAPWSVASDANYQASFRV